RQREEMGLARVTGEELEKGGIIDVVAVSQEDEPNTWMVKAVVESLPSVEGAEISISATTGTKIAGEMSQTITAPGEVIWIPVTVPNEVAEITVTRSDNGAASLITFQQFDLNGEWVGTYTFTDMTADQEAIQNQVPSGGSSGSIEEGCASGAGIAAVFAILEQLKGKPIPLTMDITADMEAGTGQAVVTIDISGLDLGEGVTMGEPEPQTIPFTFEGQVLTFQLEQQEGQTSTMTGTLNRKSDTWVIDGVIKSVGAGWSMTAEFSVVQQE
ncbi:MAG: hypothetical protein M1274_06020, partial [Actinobacteria bacterium]|nr:hypothetical protein [Actinomycetota bacterium]